MPNSVSETSLPPLLTKKATAQFFSVSERTIDRWLVEGVLPPESKVVIGGSSRFRTVVLLAVINHVGEGASQ